MTTHPHSLHYMTQELPSNLIRGRKKLYRAVKLSMSSKEGKTGYHGNVKVCPTTLLFIPYVVHLCVTKCTLFECQTPFTRAKKIGTARQIFGTVPRLPVLRLPPGGSIGTPKILSTGATLHLGPIRLHVENWGCRADFFSACKSGFNVFNTFYVLIRATQRSSRLQGNAF